MILKFYMDHHVPAAVTDGLRLRGIDVLMTYEDGAAQVSDQVLLNRATALDRVLVSQDEDLLSEGAARQRGGIPFSGIIFSAQGKLTIGDFIDELELIARASLPGEFANRIEYLPLK